MTNTLNIGLAVGTTEESILPSDVLLVIVGLGANILRADTVVSEYEYNGALRQERTLVVDTDRPLTDTEMEGLAIATRQEAIPQRTNGVGKLYGPKAAEWGPFNAAYFHD